MKIGFFLTLLLPLLSCGSPDLPEFASLLDRQPYVLRVQPTSKSTLLLPSDISLNFSHPIDPETVNNRSLLLLASDPNEFSLAELHTQISKGKLTSLEYEFAMNEDDTRLSLTASSALDSGSYWILVMPDIFTPDHIPFNQTPGVGPTPFISEFEIDTPPQETQIEEAEQPAQPATETNSDPATADSPDNNPSPIDPHPTYLYLSEILYDAVSADDGNVFIELYGEPGKSISDYQIVLINGDTGTSTEKIKLPQNAVIPTDGYFVIADAVAGTQNTTNIANADWITNFDPQNGPDCLQLLSSDGKLLDTLGYGSPQVPSCYQGTPAIDVAAGSSLQRMYFDLITTDNSQAWSPSMIPTPGN